MQNMEKMRSSSRSFQQRYFCLYFDWHGICKVLRLLRDRHDGPPSKILMKEEVGQGSTELSSYVFPHANARKALKTRSGNCATRVLF